MGESAEISNIDTETNLWDPAILKSSLNLSRQKSLEVNCKSSNAIQAQNGSEPKQLTHEVREDNKFEVSLEDGK